MSVMGDPALTAISRVVCEEWAVWTGQLLGSVRAGSAVSNPNNAPYSTGLVCAPSRLGHVVLSRRMAWHIAGAITSRPVTEIAEAYGGHSPSTVRLYAAGIERLEKQYTGWRISVRDRIASLTAMVAVELCFLDT